MIKDTLKEFLPLIEATLENELSYDKSGEYVEHYKAMEYSLLSSGKRLRPFIMGAFYRVAGGTDNAYLKFAAALEMIHTYSLIHDDLPSMDNDDFRRGRPSCHKAFDEATALLAGDGLLTKAFETAASTQGVDPALVVKGIGYLARLAGADGMIGGQVIDLGIEDSTVPLETVTEMYRKKTGALLVAAAKIGTLLAGGDHVLQNAAEDYAINLGTAFQIRDDILDLIGDAKLLGKPVGSDDKNQKSTYVSIVGMEQAKKDVEAFTENAKNALSVFENDTGVLSELADYLIDREY